MKWDVLPQEYQDLSKKFNAYCYHSGVPGQFDYNLTPQGRDFWLAVLDAKNESELPPILVTDYSDKDPNKQFNRSCGISETFIPWGDKWYCNGVFPILPVYYIKRNPRIGSNLYAFYWLCFRLESYRSKRLEVSVELGWDGFYIKFDLMYCLFSIVFTNPIAKWQHEKMLKKPIKIQR